MADDYQLPGAPGHYLSLREDQPYARAYFPDNLPPTIEFDDDTVVALARAMHALGRLDGLVSEVENPGAVFSSFVYKEAEQSSQIEGTAVTVSDIYRMEIDELDVDPPESDHERDVREAKNYVRALEEALSYLDTAGRSRESISLGLVTDLHETLMERGRTEEDDPLPGEFRPDLVHIAETNDPGQPRVRFVPPPPDVVESEMESLMQYVQTGRGWPDLIDVALTHYQFETIHPFRDGNGRVGRLLVVVMLLCSDLLVNPVLYPSSYFKRHRDEYTDRLLAVSEQGEWEAWLQFFLEGVGEQASEAFVRAKLLVGKRHEYEQTYESAPDSVRRLATSVFAEPYVSVPEAAELIEMSYQSANRAVERLVEDDVLTEITGHEQHRVFRANEVMDIVERPPGELPSPGDVMTEGSAFELQDL
jgi:Fic family protein